MAKIKNIKAREILASGGAPSVEVTVVLETGVFGEASVSYGASAGSKEAFVLLDNDEKRYNGRGMLKAVDNINSIIAPKLIGMEAGDQRLIDQTMIEIDGTELKTNLGANAILGVSMAVARAQAHEEKLMLYQYLRKIFGVEGDITLPRPMMVMIEGGKHADETTDLQEYLVSSLGNRSQAENVRIQTEIYRALKKILKANNLSTNVGSEGAFAPNGIGSNEKPMEFLTQAIKDAGYVPGVDAGISIDAAASEYYDEENKIYDLKIEGKKLSSDELLEVYKSWVAKYPIITMEDMFSEFDWDNWPKLVNEFGDKIAIIADDLTVTNTKLWQKAIDLKAANAILIKLNQAGTVTETMDCCLLARKYNLATVPSHRGGGETNDTFLVDLAVAVGSAFIKVGPTRGERVCKYNRLMRIEEEIIK